MIHFAVVVGDPAAVERAAGSGLADVLESTSFLQGEPVGASSPSGRWIAAAIAAPDPLCDRRLVADGEQLVVFNGPALHVGGRQAALADEVAVAYREQGGLGVSDLLGGTYNVVGVSPAHGAVGFSDPSGLTPLYWGQGRGFVVYSNRSTTVSRLIGDGGWDVEAMAWLVARPNLCGEEMPARGARYATPGTQVRTPWGGGAGVVERSPNWIWPGPDADEPREDLTSDEWDAITEELVGNVRSLGPVLRVTRLNLTGGKDSRLCLALAKAAGLGEGLRTQTWGTPDSPEVEVAAAVARAAGFDHDQVLLGAFGVRNPTSAESPPEPVEEQPPPPLRVGFILRALCRHVYRHEAIVCPWDGGARSIAGTTLEVKGFAGELYRGPGGTSRRLHELSADERTPEKAHRLLANQHNHPFDVLDLLHPRTRARLDDWLRGWIDRARDDVRFDLLGEKFFVDYRLGHWNGPLGQNSASLINVNPLMAPTANRKITELALHSRDIECFHFEVMRRAAPELLTVPFLDQTWSPELAQRSGIDLPTDSYHTVRDSAGTRWKKPQKWRLLDEEGQMLDAVFESATDVGLDEVCDVRRLREVIGDPPVATRNTEAKTLYSLLGISIALLGREEANVDRPLDVPSESARAARVGGAQAEVRRSG